MFTMHLLDWVTVYNVHCEAADPNECQMLCGPVHVIVQEALCRGKKQHFLTLFQKYM
jgi:hypothetical protein